MRFLLQAISRLRRPARSRPAGRCRPWLEELEHRLAPARLTVTSALDLAALTPGTLRQAVRQASADAGRGISDTIVFDTARMGGNSVTLSQGQLELSGARGGTITLDGGGHVTISGNNASRVLQVDGGVTAVLTGLAIQGGNAGAGYGGGIANWGTLSVSRCTISGCSAALGGGGVVNYASLTLSTDVVSDNTETRGGQRRRRHSELGRQHGPDAHRHHGPHQPRGVHGRGNQPD